MRTSIVGGRAAVGRRVAWGVLDQVLSSLSNFVLLVIVARNVSAPAFGSFALAAEVYLVAVWISRGFTSDPLLAKHAADGPDETRRAVRAGGSVTLASALAMAALVTVAALLVGGTLGRNLLALAVFLPGLVLQDFLRYALLVQRRAKAMFLNDLLWLVVQLPLLVLAVHMGGASASMILAWGAAGTLAALFGLVQARVWTGAYRDMARWLRSHRDVWPFFLVDNVVFRMTPFVTLVVISFVASLTEVGAFRAAISVFAPVVILSRGMIAVLTPELARRRASPARVRRGALAASLFLTVLPLGWLLVVLVGNETLGPALFGESWAAAEPLVPYAAVISAGAMFGTGAIAGLRAVRAARQGLRSRLVVTLIVLVGACIGGLLDGSFGVFVVLAALAPFQAATWWHSFLSVTRAPAT